jgi:hypothetical protein
MSKDNACLNFQLVDNPAIDAFEQIVELYYQCQGYITSSNKWFRPGTKEGYRDVDVLAIKDKEIRIIQVVTNMDDKRPDKLNLFFDKAIEYLNKNYTWLVADKKIIRTLAIENEASFKLSESIEIVKAREIAEAFRNALHGKEKGLCVKNPIFKAIEFFNKFNPETSNK